MIINRSFARAVEEEDTAHIFQAIPLKRLLKGSCQRLLDKAREMEDMHTKVEPFSPIIGAKNDHVQRAFCIAAGLSLEKRDRLPAIPDHLQKLFLRAEEYEEPARDQWGNWEHSYSDNYKRGCLWVPECDLWVQEQRDQLCQEETLKSCMAEGQVLQWC